MEPGERQRIFDRYFSIFPWDLLPKQGATGADIGCGSGRWAALVAPRVAKLHLVDASEAALEVAKRNLCSAPNV
ncbi:MAG: class I SAM-dependent methyltransferase, partial [Methyloceanibacter sp.]